MFLRCVLVALLGSGCPGDDAHDGGETDGATDTDDTADAPRDGDGALDSPRDTHQRPDVTDGGSDDPGWAVLPSLPDGCLIEYAAHPDRVLDLEWVACGVGCSYLEAAGQSWTEAAQVDTGTYDGRGLFSLGGDSPDGYFTQILADTDGTIWGAWRGPPLGAADVCHVQTPHGGNGFAAFVVRILVDDRVREERVYHAPLDALREPLEPTRVLTPETGFPVASAAQPVVASDTTVAARVPSRHVYVFQEGELEILGGVAPVVESPQLINLVGDHVLWSEWQLNVRVVHGRLGQRADVYYEVPDRRVFGFSVDNGDAAWIQCAWDGARCSEPELWTARYTPDPADFEPRRVRQYPAGGQSVTAGGLYLHHRVRDIEAFRLSDGTRLLYDLDGLGVVYGDTPIFRLSDEVAFATRIRGTGTVLRVRYDQFTEAE